MHLGSPQSDPLHKQGTGGWPGEPLEWRQSYSNAPGQTGVDPGKLIERTLCEHPTIIIMGVKLGQ